LIATLTPAAHRPYIDGTTNNSAVVMVVGYNGVSRFGAGEILGTLRGAATGSGLSAGSSGSYPGAVGGGGIPPQVQQLLEQTATQGRTGWGKLFAPDLATQIGWLCPLAILALLVGLARRRGT